MKKNLGWVLLIVLVLVGGWYMMSANRFNDSMDNQNNQEMVLSENQKVLSVVSNLSA